MSGKTNSMLAALGGAEFRGFGPSVLIQQTRGRVRRHSIPSDRLAGRKLLREHCPKSPGVYGWLNRDGRLIYVGKSKCLQARLLSYFALNPSDPKMGRIRAHSERIVWEPISNELLALIREQELIFRWTPEFNSQGQPTRRLPAFLCLSKSPAPTLFSTTRLTSRAAYAWGPIQGASKLSEAAVACNYLFGLRDCSDRTAFEFGDQMRLFEQPTRAKCIRYELKSCPAPCAAACTKSEYRAGVRRAIDFIEGRDRTVVQSIERQMHEAAAALQFERAAAMRDRFESIRRLDGQLERLRVMRNRLNGVLPVEARRKRTAWLVLKGGQLVGNMLQPVEPQQALSTAERVKKLASQSSESYGNRLDIKLQLIISGWFRKQKELQKSLLDFDEALQQCQRAAIGQVARQ